MAETVDADAFQHNGKWYLIWGSDGPLNTKPLRPSNITLWQQPNDDSDKCTNVFPAQPAANPQPYPLQTLREASFVINNNGYEYLFTSGSNWKDHHSYSISMGRRLSTDDPCTQFTPYETDAYGNGNAGLVLTFNSTWDDPGSNSAFQGANGNWWIIYSAKPEGTGTRLLMIDPVTFTPDNWIEINPNTTTPGTPTSTQQPKSPAQQ